jgi:plasmid stabilization system protein ParE
VFVWYSNRNAVVAADFEREVDRVRRLIADAPLRWPRFDAWRRRLVLRKFPYSLIYEVIGRRVVILAVAHGRRRPDYWQRRARRR